MTNWQWQFWSETRSKERAYPLRYVSDERRSCSPKVPLPVGETHLRLISSLLVGYNAKGIAPSSRLEINSNLGLPIGHSISLRALKWDAKDYHKNSATQQKWAQELISKLALKGSERVLDIGCGDGKITAEIAEKLPDGSVLGIDSSEEMIGFARENFPPNKYPNLAFQLMDARDMNFVSEFNVVFSNSALHWVIDHLPILKGIKRGLKSGGKLLLQIGGKGNAVKIFEVSQAIVHSKKWSGYFTDFSFPWGFYGVEEYDVWLKDVGLKAKRVELIPKNMLQKEKEGLAGWVRTTWLPYTQRIPEEFREEFIGEIVDMYARSCPMDNEGFIHIQMVRLEVEAEN